MGACSFEEIQPQLSVSRKELVDLLALDRAARIECIFLGGSIAEGLGNPRSDVDVYLIAESVEPFKAEEEKFKSLMLGERIVAPTFFSAAGVADACRRAAAGESISAAEIDLLHRIRTGVALAGEGAFEAMRARVPGEALARLLVRSGEA